MANGKAITLTREILVARLQNTCFLLFTSISKSLSSSQNQDVFKPQKNRNQI